MGKGRHWLAQGTCGRSSSGEISNLSLELPAKSVIKVDCN